MLLSLEIPGLLPSSGQIHTICECSVIRHSWGPQPLKFPEEPLPIWWPPLGPNSDLAFKVTVLFATVDMHCFFRAGFGSYWNMSHFAMIVKSFSCLQADLGFCMSNFERAAEHTYKNGYMPTLCIGNTPLCMGIRQLGAVPRGPTCVQKGFQLHRFVHAPLRPIPCCNQKQITHSQMDLKSWPKEVNSFSNGLPFNLLLCTHGQLRVHIWVCPFRDKHLGKVLTCL